MNYFKFDFKLSLFLFPSFVLMTVVGTLTHELGHYSVSRLLGYEANLNYKSSSFWNDELNNFFKETHCKYAYEIKNGLNFPTKEKYIKFVEKYKSDHFIITLGGPLQTMLTGSIGLILFISFKKKFIISGKVKFMSWIFIFLTLFWLRQLVNLCIALARYLIKDVTSLNSDEVKLASYLGYNIWSLQILTGVTGLGVLILVLKCLPKDIILTFLLTGITGGILGYYLWLIKYGHIIMP